MDWSFNPTKDSSLFIVNRKKPKAALRTKSTQITYKKYSVKSSESTQNKRINKFTKKPMINPSSPKDKLQTQNNPPPSTHPQPPNTNNSNSKSPSSSNPNTSSRTSNSKANTYKTFPQLPTHQPITSPYPLMKNPLIASLSPNTCQS